MRLAHGANEKRDLLERRRRTRRRQEAILLLVVGGLLGAGVVQMGPGGDPSDSVPPTVLAVEPDEGAFLPAGVTTFRLTFSEPLAASPSVALSGAEHLPVDETRFDGRDWQGDVFIPRGVDGAYALRIADVRDGAGNALPPLAVPYEVDATPPISWLSVAAKVASAPFDIAWNASDGDGSGVAHVELWIRADDGREGPWTLLTMSEKDRGAFRFDAGPRAARFDAYALAVDRAGNYEGEPASPEASIAYDPTLPSATIRPVGRYWFRDALPLTIDAGPNVAHVDVVHFASADNSTWDGPNVAGTVRAPFRFTFESGDATYYRLAVRAYDAAGRAGPTPTVDDTDVSVAVDTNPPTATLAQPVDYWQRGPLVLTANATDDASGVAIVTLTYAYRANDAANWSAWIGFDARVTRPWSWTFPFPAGAGHYALAVRTEDVAGNARDITVADLIIGYGPVPPSAALLPVDGYWFRAPMDLAAAVGSNVTSVELRYYFAADDVTWQGPFAFGNATSFAWTFDFPHGPGHYRLYAQARDAKGQREPDQGAEETEVSAGFDAEPPGSQLAPVSGYWHNASLAVSANASDDRSGVDLVGLWYAYRPNATGGWSNWTVADARREPPWTFTFDPPQDGRYALATRARDEAGNEEALPPIDEADIAVGLNRNPPTSPYLFVPQYVDPAMIRTNVTWFGSPEPDVVRFEVHRGPTADFETDGAPCSDSSTCVAAVGREARTAWVVLPSENVTYYVRVRVVDDGGLENVTTAMGAIHHGLGFDTPDGYRQAAPLPVDIAWSERLEYDRGCGDCLDAFVVPLARFDALDLRLAVPPTGDFRLVLFDADFEDAWASDDGGFGGWESLVIEVARAGTYYVVIDWGFHAGPDGGNEGWYTLSATVVPA